jgi:hypothetical protein
MSPSRRLLLPLFFCTALAHAAPAATDWRAAAQQDMQFAIDTIRSSHAGAVSGQLDVTAPLEAGGRSGMAEAANVRTEKDYRRAMVRFISGFGDPHTGINLHLKIEAWTGVVVDRVGSQYRVIWSEPNWPHPLPPLNATVQSCDGVWVGTYLKSNVAPFINHSLEYATTASQAARQSMFDLGLGWTPKQCVFTLADGTSRRYDLPLQAVAGGIGDERIAQVRKQYAAKGRPVGLYPLAADMHWVAMPDFNGAISAAAYEKLYPQLAVLMNSSWVVFDLRGNGGGNSSWGGRALQALYGKEYGERLGDTAAYSKLLIADQATVGLYQRYASLPEYAASTGEFEDILRKLEAAVRGGEKMAQVDGGTREQAAALAAQVRRRPSGPRIAAVIDRGCFSSCMNFVQQISSMADTVVLGEPTLGYSPYGEINRFDLPSGNGSLTIPAAIYTAFQATREPFVPDLPYSGNMADEPALMKWVAATLTTLKPGQKH